MKYVTITVGMTVKVPKNADLEAITVEFPYERVRVEERGSEIDSIVVSHETINVED